MKLGDFCKTGAGGTPLKSNKNFYDGGNIPWLLSGEVGKRDITESKKYITQEGLEGSSAKLFPKNTVLIAMYGATAGEVGILRFEASTNQAVCGIYPNDKVLPEYLYYFFLNHKAALVAQAVGNAQPNISQAKIKSTEVPLPPVEEQKRIVALLDTVFADLEQASARTEQNLKNARELFDSYLEKVGGEKKSLGEFVNIKTGKLNSNAAVEEGRYPFFTCSREIFAIDSYSFDCEAILLAGNNASGDFNVKHYKGKFDAYQRTYVITITNENNLLYGFLYYQMLKSLKELKNSSVGAGTKFLKIGMIKDLKISIPPIDTQVEILENLQKIQLNTRKLEETYMNKLSSIDELKKSILQKAFSGELTKVGE